MKHNWIWIVVIVGALIFWFWWIGLVMDSDLPLWLKIRMIFS